VQDAIFSALIRFEIVPYIAFVDNDIVCNVFIVIFMFARTYLEYFAFSCRKRGEHCLPSFPYRTRSRRLRSVLQRVGAFQDTKTREKNRSLPDDGLSEYLVQYTQAGQSIGCLDGTFELA
jgi:hypothetical protein